MNEDHKLIYYINKWAPISNEEAQIILNAFEPIELKRKSHLLRPGQICSYNYFITRGCIRSYSVDKKGVENIYQLRMDNNWISDLESFFSHKPSRYYIEALEDSHLLRITEEQMNKLYDQIPQMERYFRILFQKAYVNSLMRLNKTMWDSASERYSEMLREHPQMFQRVPLAYIASYLGITPESLSRIRKQKK